MSAVIKRQGGFPFPRKKGGQSTTIKINAKETDKKSAAFLMIKSKRREDKEGGSISRNASPFNPLPKGKRKKFALTRKTYAHAHA